MTRALTPREHQAKLLLLLLAMGLLSVIAVVWMVTAGTG